MALLTTFALLLGLLGPLAAVGTASAATAIACTDQAIGQAVSNGGDYTFSCGPNPVTIIVTGRTVSKGVSFNGGGFITLSGNNANRLFNVNSGVTVSFRNMTLRNAKYSLGGGALNNLGTINLTNVTLTDNTAQQGAAVLNGPSGTLTVTDSTISDNRVTGNGGGIYNSGGTLTIANSVISGNTAGTGGGIYASGSTTIRNTTVAGNTAATAGGMAIYSSFSKPSTMTVSNSTISGNSATGASGGGGLYVFNSTTATLNNVTISDNTSGGGSGGIRSDGTLHLNGATIAGNRANGSGGGLYVSGLAANVANTLIAENTAAIGPDCYSTSTKFVSRGYNLVENATGCPVTGDPTGNLIGVDPLLGALANNGGAVQTRALTGGSPAINAGSPATANGTFPACNATDGRGVSRTAPAAGRCDIGAFETQGTSSPPVMTKPLTTLVHGTLGTGSSGAAGVKVKWSARDADGIATYAVQRKTNSGSWTTVSLATPTDTEIVLPLGTSSTYTFRVRATDGSGATSAWKPSTAFTLLLLQEAGSSVSTAGAWTSETLAGSSGGSVRWADTAGASTTLSASSVKGLAWVTTKGPDRGKAQVYVDGMLAAAVDLYASSFATRQVVFVANNLAAGAHTLEVRALGTQRSISFGTRVDIDGFVILR